MNGELNYELKDPVLLSVFLKLTYRFNAIAIKFLQGLFVGII